MENLRLFIDYYGRVLPTEIPCQFQYFTINTAQTMEIPHDISNFISNKVLNLERPYDILMEKSKTKNVPHSSCVLYGIRELFK